MRRALVISLADLRFVSVRCQHCRTRVVLDLQEPSEHATRFGVLLPNECPGCRKSYDTALAPGLVDLQNSYRNLLKIEKQIEFQSGEIEHAPGEDRVP